MEAVYSAGRPERGVLEESFGNREGRIYPGGGSELHFPGHEWQINKQFAFAGKREEERACERGGEK